MTRFAFLSLIFALCLAPMTGKAETPAATPATTAGAMATTTTAAKPLSAQNMRMQTCVAQYHAKSIPSAQYKTFMSSCLKTPAPALAATTTAKTPTAQQQKMSACNATAKSQNLTADARKTFMSTCLSAKN